MTSVRGVYSLWTKPLCSNYVSFSRIIVVILRFGNRTGNSNFHFLSPNVERIKEARSRTYLGLCASIKIDLLKKFASPKIVSEEKVICMTTVTVKTFENLLYQNDLNGCVTNPINFQ